MTNIGGLFDFIEASPSVFHVIDNFRSMLTEQGFLELSEAEDWRLRYGGRYFVTRADSSVIAFRLPASEPEGFMISAAHSDSPGFKLTDAPELVGRGYLRLSTEKYGGMLMSSWFDRPLSVAGRLTLREDGRIVTRLVNIDRDLLVIPNVAIHMNREANNGMKFQANVDTVPLYGDENAGGSFIEQLSAAAGVDPSDILDADLYLYCRGRGTVLGANRDYIVSPKLDDLECAFACMSGFAEAEDSEAVSVCCVFNNEEVGSETKQGAASTMLRDTLRRICRSLGLGEEQYLRLLARSFMVSADNAHAKHPNHPEYANPNAAPLMNGGIVIKYNANQRYTTDAVSAAVFKSICADVSVPVQSYANRADMAGGSTLGSIADTHVPVPTVDIGLAQLAMHSAVETAGAKDFEYLLTAMREFHGRSLRIDREGIEIV